MAKHTVQTGQDIFDIAIQRYGGIEFYLNIIKDNSLSIDDFLKPSQELTVNNENTGNAIVKNEYKKTNFIVMNASIEDVHSTAGDYNNDYNDDYQN